MLLLETYIENISVVPFSIVSDVNSSVLINCIITLNTVIGPDTSFITHYWYNNDNTDITSRSTPLMISGEGTSLITTLNISSVQPSDAGLYECRASIDKNNTQMKNTTRLYAKGLINKVLLLFDISYLSVPNSFIGDSHYYTNLRLGDIIEHDCTPGYRQSGVTVQWRTPDNSMIMNPLIITVNQSTKNGSYTCFITISNHDTLANEIAISVKGNVNFIVDLNLIHFNRYICADSDN